MKSLVLALCLFGSSTVFAGECVIHYNRTACPGQEEASYAKCGGKKECDETKEAKSEKDCAKKALKACDNARLQETKAKAITAMFDGKPVEGGKNFCDSDRPDFNKCK